MSRDSGKFIRVDDEQDVREWCARLECTETDLHTAVNAVGGRPSWVTDYLMARKGRVAVRARPIT